MEKEELTLPTALAPMKSNPNHEHVQASHAIC